MWMQIPALTYERRCIIQRTSRFRTLSMFVSTCSDFSYSVDLKSAANTPLFHYLQCNLMYSVLFLCLRFGVVCVMFIFIFQIWCRSFPKYLTLCHSLVDFISFNLFLLVRECVLYILLSLWWKISGHLSNCVSADGISASRDEQWRRRRHKDSLWPWNDDAGFQVLRWCHHRRWLTSHGRLLDCFADCEESHWD